jgi:acetate kinase
VAEPILVVNAGSSSLKLSIIANGDHPVADATVESWDGADAEIISSLVGARTIAAVGHRVVHGGSQFTAPVLIDDAVRNTIATLTPLAPLHQPRSLAGIDAARRALPDAAHVACFDTAFHASLPAAASTYAIPAEWREQWPIRRYGFHGLSHAWASRRAAELAGRPIDSVAMVTCHLGAGASLCAVDGGRSVDTTMGFTPLEGLVMATRSGSVDPGLVLWLLDQGLSVEQVADGLEHRSGLVGLAGTGDLRDILAARAAGDTAAALAFAVYVHRLRREILAMTASLGRLDLLVFTGGIGEHNPEVRAAAAAGLGHLGIALDDTANRNARGDTLIGRADSGVMSVVVTAREDLEITEQVRVLLAGRDR